MSGCFVRTYAFSQVTRSITKHNFLVMDINDLPRIMKEAFYLARSGRPGEQVIAVIDSGHSQWTQRDAMQGNVMWSYRLGQRCQAEHVLVWTLLVRVCLSRVYACVSVSLQVPCWLTCPRTFSSSSQCPTGRSLCPSQHTSHVCHPHLRCINCRQSWR